MKRFGLLCAGLLLALGLAGCEPDDDDVRGELEVEPASTWLEGEEGSVMLTASVGEETEPIVYPLEWSVSNPSVGRIVSQSADRAVYAYDRPVEVLNVVTVRDQLGREGIAMVGWKPEDDEETAE